MIKSMQVIVVKKDRGWGKEIVALTEDGSLLLNEGGGWLDITPPPIDEIESLYNRKENKNE